MNCRLSRVLGMIVLALFCLFCYSFNEGIYGDVRIEITENYDDFHLPDIMSCSELEIPDNVEQIDTILGRRQTDYIHMRAQENFIGYDILSVEINYAENDKPIIYLPRFRFDRKSLSLNPQGQSCREYATKMAIDNHLSGYVFPYGQRYHLFMNNGNIVLPYILSKLPVQMSHIQGPVQREMETCGSCSVANALALCDAIVNGLPLESTIIQTLSQRYGELRTQKCMTSKEQIALARSFGLSHTYVLTFFKNDLLDSTKMNRFPFSVIESTEYPVINLYRGSEVLEEIVGTIRSQTNITAHFLCHLGAWQDNKGHVALVSIVKRSGEQTKMIYMDSNNLPVGTNSLAAAYICYLYWQCIA
jgi:hypothetical protein